VADEPDVREASDSGSDQTLTNVHPVRPGDPDENFSLAPGFSAGQILAGRYKVEQFLARGGMGEVYQVYDQELGESVALKTILPRMANDPVTLDRFRREIQIARKVSHRNVCRIFDLGRNVEASGEDVVFLTMELLSGVSLRARLREGVMEPTEAFGVVEQLTAGLGAAHRKGIVHRDLKPSNIFLVPEGPGVRVVIADFGLARLQVKDESQLTVTGTGEILGTPAYMSPEQIEGQSATTASDIYSLGLVMYEMLTGAQAFEGASEFQIALNKLREAPTSPSMRSPGVPPRWDRTILRCLEKAPEDRFSDVESIPLVLAGQRRMPRRRFRGLAKRPAGWAAAAMVLLAVVGATAVFTRGWPPWTAPDERRAPVALRQSVAVLGFENLTEDPSTEWISTALGDFLTTELGAGGEVRTIPSESVAHARAELGIDRVTTLGSEKLGQLRDLLAADLVVLGSYAVLGEGSATTIRLDARVQDIGAEETIILQGVTGTRNDLPALAIAAAAEIRNRFGLDVTAESTVSGAFPQTPEAARLYAEGVVKLRSFDPSGARVKLAQATVIEPDSPLIWIELANAWRNLGYGNRAMEAATRSKDLSEGLGRELRLRIEGQYQVLAGRMDEAVDTFRSLWLVYPDNLEYGLMLAEAQVAAGLPEAALATVAELRMLPMPLSGDPRIDLAEADAAGSIGDASRQAAAAERVVAASQRIGSSVLEAEGRLALGEGLRGTGKLDLALIELEAARDLEIAAGNRLGEATAAYFLAVTHLALGDLDAGTREAQTCLATAREVEARTTEGNALNLLGSIRLRHGDLAGALEFLNQALELQREIGNRSGEADAFNNVALVQMWSGDFVSAVDSFTQVRAQFRDLGRAGHEAQAVMNLARVDAARGDLDGSRSLFEEAAGLYRIQDNAEALAEALFGLGEVLLTQGDLTGARTRHEEALALRRDHEFGSVVESEFALAGLTLAEAASGRGSYDDAVAELTQSVARFAELERPAYEADALNYLAEAELGAGLVDAAAASLERIRELESSANSVTLMVLTINEARLAGRRGRYDEARSMLETLLVEARSQSSFGVEIEGRLAMAEIMAESGDEKGARRLLAEVKNDATARGWILVADKAAEVEERSVDSRN
jgi:eukaryotic-like serine/threonine-protein kinase